MSGSAAPNGRSGRRGGARGTRASRPLAGCAHQWELTRPHMRYRCTLCPVLGYRRGRRIYAYKCADPPCQALAVARRWAGTIEKFWCPEHTPALKKDVCDS